MGRRGRKRWLSVEDEYWKLILAGVGPIEAARRIGIARGSESDGQPHYESACAESPTCLSSVLGARCSVLRAPYPPRRDKPAGQVIHEQTAFVD